MFLLHLGWSRQKGKKKKRKTKSSRCNNTRRRLQRSGRGVAGTLGGYDLTHILSFCEYCWMCLIWKLLYTSYSLGNPQGKRRGEGGRQEDDRVVGARRLDREVISKKKFQAERQRPMRTHVDTSHPFLLLLFLSGRCCCGVPSILLERGQWHMAAPPFQRAFPHIELQCVS